MFGNLAVQLVSKQKELYYTASRMEVTYTGSLSRAPVSDGVVYHSQRVCVFRTL